MNDTKCICSIPFYIFIVYILTHKVIEFINYWEELLTESPPPVCSHFRSKVNKTSREKIKFLGTNRHERKL